MKYLLVLAVVLIGIMLWRNNRARDNPKPPVPRPGPDPAQAIDMVRCDVCGTHCPQADAVVGKQGVYCTLQHRNQVEH